MKKARTENFITKFARYYTPVVCLSALALAVVPSVVSLLMGDPAAWSTWVIRALTFLVISCPCALVISIPLSFFGGIGGASSCGILVKGSNYLEALAQTKYVVFDKTGTLTKGVFQVTGVYPAPEFEGGDQGLVELAACAESYSTHPISRSLKEAFAGDVDPARVGDVEEIGGYGVTATVDGKQVAAGNGKLMKKLGLYGNRGSCGCGRTLCRVHSDLGCGEGTGRGGDWRPEGGRGKEDGDAHRGQPWGGSAGGGEPETGRGEE